MPKLNLAFTDDTTIYRKLPRRKPSADLWPNLPPASSTKPIPLVYGRDQLVPAILVDSIAGKYLACESPSDTPVNVKLVETVIKDRLTGRDKLFPLYSPPAARVIDTLAQDAKLEHAPGGANQDNVNSASFGVTAKGSNRIILAWCAIDDEAQAFDHVLCGGLAMTFVDAVSGSAGDSNLRLELWILVNPPLGHQVVTAYLPTGVFRNVTIQPQAFSSVDTTTPLGTVAKQVSFTSSLTINVTGVAGSLVVDALFTAQADISAVGAGQTEAFRSACHNAERPPPGTLIHHLSTSTKAGSAGSIAMARTLTTVDSFAQMGVAVRGLNSVATTWVALTEIGQTFRVPQAGFGDAFTFKLRPKPGDPAPAGRVTIRVEVSNDGVPSGDMVDPVATKDLDAALVTGSANYAFQFDLPPLFPSDQLAVTIRYAAAAGAGGIDIATNPSGGYDDGALCNKGTSRDEWVQTETSRVLSPVYGLGGDGTLTAFPYFGKNLFDYVLRGDHKTIPVGTLYDGIGAATEARSFLRIDITGVALADFAKAILRLYLVDTDHMEDGHSGTVVCDEIPDYTTLTAPTSLVIYDSTSVPWWSPTQTSFGAIATEETARGSFVDVDITAALTNAIADGRTTMAFRLSTTGFGHNLTWYFVAAEETGSNVPGLRLVKAGGQDLQFALDMVQFTVSDSIDDGSGNNVALVDFSRPLGDNRLVVAALDGMADTGGGDYTGVPDALIENLADIVRHVGLHPIALGLDASRVNLSALADARSFLASNWIAGAGVVFEELDAQEWLARIAESFLGIHYQDESGRLAVAVASRRTAPVRRIRPWETINLQPKAGGALNLTAPWSRVDVYYGRDLVRIDNPPGSASESAEWDGYAYVSKSASFPADPSRQAVAADRDERYGERTNGQGAGPSAGSTFYFVPADSGTGSNGRLLRDRLFDVWGKMPELIGAVSFELPRFGANLALNDEIDITSFTFPSSAPVLRPGQVHWKNSNLPGPVTWKGGIVWHRARRGRFSVREQTVDLAGGAKSPTVFLCKLLEWRTK